MIQFKKHLFVILVLGTHLLHAQNNDSEKNEIVLDTVNKIVNDSIMESYIQDHNNQLNIKFDVSNEIVNYYLPFDEGTINVKPNLGTNYALVFNYRFVSLRLGIRPKKSSASIENEGESSTFRINLKLLFNKWSHQFTYNYIQGYYVANSTDNLPDIFYFEGDRHVQFPDLTTSIFTGSSMYKLNDYYSLKASNSQTEIQLKNAGSFIPGIDYRLFSLFGTDVYLDKNGNEIQRDDYSTYLGFSTIFNIGYYYTFVYKKNYYLNLTAIPGLGMDFYKETMNSPTSSNSENYFDFLASFQTDVSVGYNGEKFYFGGEYNYRTNSEKRNDGIKFYTRRNEFHVFFGYRFKAPKSVRRSVDVIENKVPMLNKDKE